MAQPRLRYLLTGSARPLGLRGLPDTLPGRTETLELWPLSQGEIDGQADGFVDAVFDDPAAAVGHSAELTRSDYAERVVRGGLPEAIARTRPERRSRFFDSYVDDLIARDVSQLSEIERPAQMHALLRLLAGRSGQLLVANALSNELQLSASSVHRYLGLAAANLLGADARTLLRPGGPFGPLLEAFVTMELARQLSWSRHRVELSHYRTKDGVEVDAVLEDRSGRVVGVEVKAAATVRADDFRGLRHLADRIGDDLIAGIVFYAGQQALPFGPRMHALPVSSLWEVGPIS